MIYRVKKLHEGSARASEEVKMNRDAFACVCRSLFACVHILERYLACKMIEESKADVME